MVYGDVKFAAGLGSLASGQGERVQVVGNRLPTENAGIHATVFTFCPAPWSHADGKADHNARLQYAGDSDAGGWIVNKNRYDGQSEIRDIAYCDDNQGSCLPQAGSPKEPATEWS
jgi:hypothetical protein